MEKVLYKYCPFNIYIVTKKRQRGCCYHLVSQQSLKWIWKKSAQFWFQFDSMLFFFFFSEFKKRKLPMDTNQYIHFCSSFTFCYGNMLVWSWTCHPGNQEGWSDKQMWHKHGIFTQGSEWRSFSFPFHHHRAFYCESGGKKRMKDAKKGQETLSE